MTHHKKSQDGARWHDIKGFKSKKQHGLSWDNGRYYKIFGLEVEQDDKRYQEMIGCNIV